MKIKKTLKISLLSVALLAIGLVNSRAQTTANWIGPATGGEWNNGANWDTTAPPLDSTTNAVIGAGTNINYNLPMVAAGFGGLTNSGVLNINTNGFNNTGIVMLNPNGTGKLFINTGGVVNVTGNLGFDSNSVVNMSVGSSLTISGSLFIGSGTNGGSSGSSPGNLGFMTNNGGFLSASATSLNPANGSVANGTANLFVINGGTNNLGNVLVGRASGSALVPLGQEGLVINGGQVNMTSLLIGNNAWGAMLVRPGATVTNTGDGRLRMIGTTLRPARLYQTGGLFVTAGTNYLSPTNNAGAVVAFSVTGGTNYSAGFQFGEFVGAGIANFTNGAVMYLGSGGIGSNGVVTVNAALNNGGLFGATADWTGFSTMNLNGVSTVFTFQTADADGTPHDITLTGGGLRGAGTLNKTGAGTLHLGATNTYTGSTLINVGTLAVDAGGALTSPLIIVGSGTTFDVSAVTGGFLLGANQTLSGSGSVNGTVTTPATVGPPAPTINPGSNTLTGTLTLQNDLVEQGGGINHFDLSGNPAGPNNDFVVVTGNLTVSGINTIETGGAPQNGATYPLIQYGTFNGDLTNFTTTSGALSNSVANKIIYLIAQSNNHAPTNVIWLGNALTNNWDMLITTNWSINGTGPATNFVTGDNAVFNNVGAANPLVNLVGGVTPGSVTVASTSDYTFTGNGAIAGNGGLLKTNTGKLTILTTNSYTGITMINGGTLSVSNLANGSSPSPIGAASSDPANLVLDSGVLEYLGGNANIDRGVTLQSGGGTVKINNGTILTLPGAFTGPGALTLTGGGEIVFNSGHDYAGGTTITAGAIRTAQGSSTTITALGTNTLTLSGVSSSAAYLFGSDQEVLLNTLNIVGNNNFITNSGNDTIQNVVGSGTLSFEGTGGNVLTLQALDMTGFTGTFVVDTLGNLRFLPSSGSSADASTATFNLGTGSGLLNNKNGNGTIQLGALIGGSLTQVRGASSSTSPSTYAIGGNNLSTVFSGSTMDGPTGGKMNLVKVGTGTLTFNGAVGSVITSPDGGLSFITNLVASATNISHTGSTVISNGVLKLVVPVTLTNAVGTNVPMPVVLASATAVLDASSMGYTSNEVDAADNITVTNIVLYTNGVFEVAPNQSLRGFGTVLASNVLADAGSIVSPGLPLGTLTASTKIELAGVVGMSVNAASLPNCSKILSPSIVIDGTAALTVTNLGPEAAATFQLFNQAVSGFASVTLPTLTGTNLWINNLAVNGSITLVAPQLVTVNTNATNIVFSTSGTGAAGGGTLSLSWPADHTGWRLLEQTNPLSAGLTHNVNNTNNWFEITNAATTNHVFLPITTNSGATFFRMIYP